MELPESRIRARRRERRTRFFILLGILAILFIGSFIWMSWTPALRIETIVVEGAKTVLPGAVEAPVREELKGRRLLVLANDNIFLYPRSRIEQDLLARFPIFKDVELRAQDFRTIIVSVLEREPRALWCGASVESPVPCLFIDEDGVAYGSAPQFSVPVYVEYYGRLSEHTLPNFLNSEQFRSLSALVDALSQLDADDSVHQVQADELNATAQYQSGFKLTFPLSHNSGDVFERFTLALESEPFKDKKLKDFEYLDLRFGDKLYYKLKNQ